MDAVQELDALKKKQQALSEKIEALNEKKAKIDAEITELRGKSIEVQNEIFQRENVVWLEAARKVASERPEFQKMVAAYAEEMQILASAKKVGRPKKKAD